MNLMSESSMCCCQFPDAAVPTYIGSDTLDGKCNCPTIAHIGDTGSVQLDGKYVQEIAAEMLDNQLIIKIEKNKKKKAKPADWKPPRDCDVIEIKRPNGNEGPKIVNAEDCNEIIFKSSSQIRFGNTHHKDVKIQQTNIVYKVKPCKKSSDSNAQCRRIKLYPGADDTNFEEVHGDRIVCDGQDIFLLRVQKKSGAKARNMELEMRTPMPPAPPRTPPPSTPVPEEITHDQKPQEVKPDKKAKAPKKPKKKKK